MRAWLNAEGGLVITATASATSSFPWASAVTRLITGVNATFGEERYRYLRRRIFHSGEISTWDRNLVKVCAKRIGNPSKGSSAGSSDEYSTYPTSATRVLDVGMDLLVDETSERGTKIIGSFMPPNEALEWTAKTASFQQQTYSNTKLHQAPRCISCILVDANGMVLGANVNTNVGFQLRHAEVNLLLSLASRGINKIPPGSTLYTSLKPCRMCASLIIQQADLEKTNTINTNDFRVQPLRIIALNDDRGPHGRHEKLANYLQFIPHQLS